MMVAVARIAFPGSAAAAFRRTTPGDAVSAIEPFVLVANAPVNRRPERGSRRRRGLVSGAVALVLGCVGRSAVRARRDPRLGSGLKRDSLRRLASDWRGEAIGASVKEGW